MYQKSSIYCTNCGRTGHHIRKCNDPIISFGIIAFKFEKDVPQVIMIQRRNSMSYVEFLRGRYNQYNTEYIVTLINGMTGKEIQDIETKDFETLWKELWINNDHKNYKNDYYIAKGKFESLDLPNIIIQKTEFYDHPEWGFPKGRRNYKELDIDCAIREFCEETGLMKDSVSIIKNVIPIREDFTGNNNVRYRHIYYLAKIKSDYKDTELKVNEEDKEQCAEISDIQWLTKEQCFEKIRSVDISRKKVVADICSFLSKVNKDFYLKYLN